MSYVFVRGNASDWVKQQGSDRVDDNAPMLKGEPFHGRLFVQFYVG